MKKNILSDKKFISTILLGLMSVEGTASGSGSAEQSPTSSGRTSPTLNPLLQAADAGNWEEVGHLLQSEEQRDGLKPEVLSAIKQLYAHHQNATLTYDAYTQRVQMAVYQAKQSMNRPQSPSLEKKLNKYMQSRFILSIIDPTKVAAIKAGIQDYIKATGKWPDDLSVKEQFYLNIGEEYIEIKEIQKLFAYTKKLNWKDFKQFIQDDRHVDNRHRLMFPIYLAYPNAEDRSKFMTFCAPYINRVYRESEAIIMKNLLPIYQAYPKAEDRSEFIKFCNPYINGVDRLWQSRIMTDLLPIFQAYPKAEDRSEFMKFCDPYLKGVDSETQAGIMKKLLPIFQAYPKAEDRSEFMTFCEPYLKWMGKESQAYTMNNLLPIFKAYPNANNLPKFIKFCEPYINGMDRGGKTYIMNELLPIYQAYPNAEDRSEFMTFCNPYLNGAERHKQSGIMNDLLPIFQEFLSAEDRSEFITFCEPYLKKADRYMSLSKIMMAFLPIFKMSLTDPTFGITFQNFNKYMDRYFQTQISETLFSFLPRTYLRYIRTFSSLEAENNLNQNRIRANFETQIDDQLPVFWVGDPFIANARETQPFVNAHEFDPIYLNEFDLLQSQTGGYKDDLSAKVYTRYNKTEGTPDFHTNTEVEDFIHYLDTEFLTDSKFIKIDGINYDTKQIVSLVKQMLGLEPKAINVSGGFAPYLGSSMFYAQPNAPKGDEVLGRIWYLVKKLGQEEADKAVESGDDKKIEAAVQHAEALRRSVILAIVEAAEINQTSADTHCQTRITGELLKAICLHLNGSKLRGLIMSENIQTNDEADAEINARIEAAPQKAQQLFKGIHREDTGAIRTLREKHILAGTEPELFEIYLAYYDDLYQRTVISDVDGKREYKKDEHILMRDDHGNLVSFYKADGTKRETPHIVYYQAEFQVLEHTFTQLMWQEFEEQRGLKY